MINKQNLWFLTLFSLILVLSVYYITMPNDLLLNNNSGLQEESESQEEEVKDKTDEVSAVVEESEILVALRLDLEEEKNEAYEKLKYLNIVVGEEETLEAKIKTTYELECMVEVDSSEIKVVVISKNHDNTLANNIMRTIQQEYKEPKYITVQFK